MRTVLLVVALLVVSAINVQARDSKAPPPRIYQTNRIQESPPIIDGMLDDEVWNQVEWSGDFIQFQPEEGAPPTVQTEFKLLYDDEALYFAFRMHAEPDQVHSVLSRRDGFPGDWIEVNIDSYHDYRTAFSFTMSLSGTRGDEFISNDGNGWDSSWDPIWEGETKRDQDGWTAETRIPLTQLRFGGADEQVWGLQVQRRFYHAEERSTWQAVPRDINGWVSNFGEIHGISGIKSGRRLEIKPYGVAKAESFEEEAGNPFRDGRLSSLDLGLDGKLGLTSDMTLDFTLNPDFGQVEADPSQVNLTVFETFFQEKRPFFVEGANIFNLPLAPAITGGHFTRDRLFYSRRVGKRPSYYPSLGTGEYADVPTSTSILGAFKLSGKTASGLSIGILESVTAREEADLSGASGSDKQTVEPSTNYFVGRVMQDYNQGNTVVGAMLTSVNRKIEDDHLEFLRRNAYAGGVDLQHYFLDRSYKLEARVFGSYLNGSQESIDQVQTSSARYLQRPDSDHTYDPTRTSLSGSAGSLLLRGNSDSGDFRFQTGAAWRSPGFEINDIGYMSRADEINQSLWVSYSQRQPSGIFNEWSVNGNQWLTWDWAGNYLGADANINSSLQFKNRWRAYLSLTRTFANTSNTALRGGPSSRWPGETSFNFNVQTDYTKAVHFNGGTWILRADEGYKEAYNIWTGVAVRPNDAMRVSMNTSFNRTQSEMQYLGTGDFNGQDRYLFGSLDQKTFTLTFRLDYCVTPNLTVQYYGSPFISAGGFKSIKRITDPKGDNFQDRHHTFTGGEINYDEVNGIYEIDEDLDTGVDYTMDNPDFNFLDFNSNLVVRWEYDPGSTLFLVWSQARSGFDSTGTMEVGNDLDRLFGRHPHNVFLLKISKWFSV